MRCRQVMEGALVELLRLAPRASHEPRAAPSAAPVTGAATEGVDEPRAAWGDGRAHQERARLGRPRCRGPLRACVGAGGSSFSRRAAPGPAGWRGVGSRAGSPTSSSAVHGSQQSHSPSRKLARPRRPPAWSSSMARCPADGCRWQAQAAAHRPSPQPEMTTVWPSSRTLPTWKTDGLRLLLTESSPRRSHLRDEDPRRDVLGIGRTPRSLDRSRRKSSEGGV